MKLRLPLSPVCPETVVLPSERDGDDITMGLSGVGPTQRLVAPINVEVTVRNEAVGTVKSNRDDRQQSPNGFGGGLMLLMLTLTCGGAAFSYRRRQAWALSFAVIALIALGSASCGGIPKGPNGPTQPGEVTVTVTASANGATVTAPPLQLIVE